jgi:hypothetical protein
MGIWNRITTFLIGEPSGERARDSKGRYVKDDPSTPANEAYEDGRTPAKKSVKKTSAKRGRGRPKGSKNKTKSWLYYFVKIENLRDLNLVLLVMVVEEDESKSVCQL